MAERFAISQKVSRQTVEFFLSPFFNMGARLNKVCLCDALVDSVRPGLVLDLVQR